jgi:hypothetical protein
LADWHLKLGLVLLVNPYTARSSNNSFDMRLFAPIFLWKTSYSSFTWHNALSFKLFGILGLLRIEVFGNGLFNF